MAHPGFIPCHNLCHQITVAIHHSQPLPTYLDPLSHLFLGEAMRPPCARNSTQAQLLHDSDDCHLWNVQIVQQLTSWNVRVICNQGCNGIHIDLCPQSSQSLDMRDEFRQVSPFIEHFISFTMVTLFRHQSPCTPRISIIVSATDNPRHAGHAAPYNVTLFCFLFGFHRITKHTKCTTRLWTIFEHATFKQLYLKRVSTDWVPGALHRFGME